MAQRTRAACPHCHFEQVLPFTVSGSMTFQGNGMNIAVFCPICQREFDAAPGGGTYEVVGGRFRLVRELRKATRLALADASTVVELEQLISQLRSVAGGGTTTVADAIAPSGFFPHLEAWARQNPALAKILGGLLVIVLTALVTRATTPEPEESAPPVVKVEIQQPGDAELARLINAAIEEHEKQQSEPPPGKP